MKKAIDKNLEKSPEDSHESHVRPALRPKAQSGVIRLNWNPPSAQRVERWFQQVGQEGSTPIILIEGPTPAHRATVYRMLENQEPVAKEWVRVGLVNAVTERFSTVQAEGSRLPYRWGLLWNLLLIEELVVEDQLELLVNQGLAVTDVFRGLWEARFQLREGHGVYGVIETLSSWMTAANLTQDQRAFLDKVRIKSVVESNYERLDMLLFLATLCRQNHLLDRLTLIVDGIDRSPERAQELYDLCLTVERWARLGSPVGLVLGYESLKCFRGTQLATTLRKYSSP